MIDSFNIIAYSHNFTIHDNKLSVYSRHLNYTCIEVLYSTTTINISPNRFHSLIDNNKEKLIQIANLIFINAENVVDIDYVSYNTMDVISFNDGYELCVPKVFEIDLKQLFRNYNLNKINNIF